MAGYPRLLMVGQVPGALAGLLHVVGQRLLTHRRRSRRRRASALDSLLWAVARPAMAE